MKNTIELSPTQLGYFQASKVVSQTIANQVAALNEQIEKLKKEADGLARNGDRQFDNMLAAIAADHGVDSIPSTAQILVNDGVTVFAWESKTKPVQSKPAAVAKKAAAKARRQARAAKKAAAKKNSSPHPSI